jgi:hypothetical protein
MKTTMTLGIAAALVSVACSGSTEGRQPKSQQALLDEQMALADQQVAEEAEDSARFEEAEAESEKEERFDEASATHELKRATLNAQDCPNVYEKDLLGDYQPGTAELTIVFGGDGSVKEANLKAPYDGTTVGKCVQRAFLSVHVKTFVGPDVTKEWKVELGPAKPPATKQDAPKKK